MLRNVQDHYEMNEIKIFVIQANDDNMYIRLCLVFCIHDLSLSRRKFRPLVLNTKTKSIFFKDVEKKKWS